MSTKLLAVSFLMVLPIYMLPAHCLLAQIYSPTRYSITTIDELSWNNPSLNFDPKALDNIAGTPYLYESYKNGVVYYNGKYQIEQIPLRLNLYHDALEYKNKGVALVFSNPERIDKVVIAEETFIYIPKSPLYKVSGFVKLCNPKFPAIITKMSVDFFNKETSEPLEAPKPDRFERVADRHYVMKSAVDIRKINSVKKLIKHLGTHTAELKEYARQERVSANDPEELTKLINYYHQLEQ